jgi:5-methyltetrahydrofolate--homocysteine methyltransferase
VLATVKGDVHDIGKNLVDIILTNNGYRVINLGINQPLIAIVAAVTEHRADAVGMSGLLVKSTQIMHDNLQEMARQGLDLPVLLGGAALTRRFVEEDCVRAYGSRRVAYAQDAFDGLRLMEKVATGEFDDHLAGAGEGAAWPSNRATPPAPVEHGLMRPVDLAEIRLRRAELSSGLPVPKPPFLDARVVESVPLDDLLPLLNERMLFQYHWGFRKDGRTLEQWTAWADREVRPILERVVRHCREENILAPRALYGYWRCAAQANTLVLFEPDGETEAARFTFPRQPRRGGLCIADFFRDIDDGTRDVVALQLVSVGARASEVVRARFDDDRYRDYLYLHGLAVEITEALAEHVHRRIRGELGISGEDADEVTALLRQGYRGARYSFGYPACPNLEDQATILALLDAERIGVSLSDGHQLHPEFSTTALVAHHPQAKYFSMRVRERPSPAQAEEGGGARQEG